MRSKWMCLVVASAAVTFGGCAKDEPRELGREGDVGTLEGQQDQRPGGGVDAARQGQLDGKTFLVELEGPEGKKIQDELIFREGKFDSTACRQYGFSAVPYTTTRAEDGIRWNAVSSSGESTNRWTGIVKGNEIEGTVYMQQPGKDVHEGEFEGKLSGQPTGAGMEEQGQHEGLYQGGQGQQ